MLASWGSARLVKVLARWKGCARVLPSMSTSSFWWRAAISAASLHTLAMSAPEKPGESAASCLASSSISPASVMRGRCTRKISARPLMSGSPTCEPAGADGVEQKVLP